MNKKGLVLLILSSVLLFSDDSKKNEFGPSDSSDDSFVADSEFTSSEFSKGTFYNVELGVKTKERKLDTETGTKNTVDQHGNTIRSGQDNNLSANYENALSTLTTQRNSSGHEVYIGDLNENLTSSAFNSLTEAQKTAVKNARAQALAEAKAKRDDELERKGHTQKNRESLFLEGLASQGKGQRTASRFINSDRGYKDTDKYGREYIDDRNTTEFYSANYGYLPYNNDRTRLSESKAQTLIDAYQRVDDMESLVRSQTESTEIKCYISRELIEAYYCPMSDRNDVLFPDFLNGGVTIDEASRYTSLESKMKCEETCKKTQNCKGLQVQNALEKEFSEYNNKKLYPTLEASGTYALEVSDKVQTKNITFDLVVHPSSNFDGNETQFEEFLEENRNTFKVNYTLVKKPKDPNILPEAISTIETQHLHSSRISITISAYRQSDQFVLKLFKPYIYPVGTPSYERQNEAELFDKIESINVENIKVTYRNNHVFFCPVRQIVTSSDQCDSGSLLHINQGAQIFDVCLDSDHKIGDDMHTGGFWSEESCEANCYSTKECMPTYKHYTDLSSKEKVYKSSIGCVDSPENVGCQDSLCESLFSDPDIQPMSELTINSKEERVYTVKNYLRTDTPRPKIDVVGEESASSAEDFENTFQREMKDNAYLNMIDKQTFNRVKYKVGEYSPEQVSFIKEETEQGNLFKGRIKWASNRYDDNLDYRVYAVIELDSQFRLKYGQFSIPNNNGIGNTILNAEKESVMVLEKTYLINDGGTWKVFKKIFNDKVQIKDYHAYCPKAGGGVDVSKASGGVLTLQQEENNCYLQNEVTWVELTDYRKEDWVKYISKRLVRYSKSEIAKYLVKEKVDSSTAIKEYHLSDSIERMLESLPGGFVRNQITEDDGLSSTKIYDATQAYNGHARAHLFNYKLYLFTSERDISYENVLKYKLTDNALVYDHLNRAKAKSTIDDDLEIENGIVAYLLGDKRNTSIIMELKPNFSEEGKKMFKFMFLYNERETISENL